MSRKRVLVVHDREILRNVLKRALEIFGYEVVTVASAREGIHLFKNLEEKPFNAVVTNLHTLEGQELISEVCEHSDGLVPIILMADSVTMSTHEAELAGRGVTVLPKSSYHLVNLVEAIEGGA